MMLQAIRDRAQGIFAWVLLILIGIPFALWGIQNYFNSGKEIPVAVVGDRDIFERDVTRVYEEILASLGGAAQYDDKQIKRQAIERVIREESIRQATLRDRLVIGDQDVRSFIEALPYFQTDGAFDREKYQMMLSSQNLSSAEFGEQVRRGLAMEQYQKGVSDSVLATPLQVENAFRLKNQKRQVDYVVVPLAKIDPPIAEEAIAAYYDQHRVEFQNPESVTVDYVVLAMDALAEAVKPSDEELKALYEEQKASFTTKEQRRISHILIAAEQGRPEQDKAALAKIGSVKDRLSNGEDFAKLAKEVSDDPVSAQKGGDLGALSAGMLDPTFEKAAGTLAKGAISEPVRTPFGYHLIRVTEFTPAVVKPFDEVKPELAKTFQRNAVDSRFYELGQKLTELAFEHPDSLEPAAKAIGKSVERSRSFTRVGGEGIAAEQPIRNAAFSEDVLAGKNSELIELSPERVAVIRTYDHQAASDKPLEQVRGEILRKLKTAKAKEQTGTAAEELKKKLDGGSAFGALAKAAQLTALSPSPFQRDSKDIPAPLLSAVFAASKPKENKLVSGVVALDDGGQAVYQLKAVIEPSPKADDKELEMIRNYLVNASGQAQFTAWVAELRKTMDVKVTPSKE